MIRFLKKMIALLLVLLLITPVIGVSAEEKSLNYRLDDIDGEIYHTEVLVIGGGGTGLVSALRASELGSKVILLEKQGVYGGATSMSSGKIPAFDTKEQEEHSINDSEEAMYRDIYRSGEYTQNPNLLTVAVQNSNTIKEWLGQFGIKWNLETESLYYGQSEYRIHVAEGGGTGIVEALVEQIEQDENIMSFLNMEATGLLLDENDVVGAVVSKDDKNIYITADSVVLATSGFGANRDMVSEYVPSILNAVPNVAPGATGESILWGIELGADTAAMNAYQAYAPITYDSHKSLGSAFLDNGGILLNKEGNRFVDEYLGYSPLGTAIVNQPDSFAWMIWNQSIQDLEIKTSVNITEGELISANTVDELANQIGIKVEKLEKEFELYKEGIESGEDYMNRTKLPDSFDGPYYATKVTGDFRHTQGGLVINPENAQVLNDKEEPIDNLFAGGGVTEGFSSNGNANYMAGNGLLQAFVYGYIAGESAHKNIESIIDSEEFLRQKDSLQDFSEENMNGITKSKKTYKDGIYEGEADGHNGPLIVEVEVRNGMINSVSIIEHSETEGIAGSALEVIPEFIIQANGVEVDTVSGASVTSEAILKAVAQALSLAQ
ncbi:flavocytochrome c [Suicoccus acidiformans]|uniref:Urocanate reductase n=1 Tax=Suicoccus acidiformans TaxID=2036206 RepID=A0A347WIT2_9LACT|nr:FAD-dependent oxidoreductase [Suicoccus acidiformans]AXY24989.1 flavocytochrome c [Suicoccus acidiformans]